MKAADLSVVALLMVACSYEPPGGTELAGNEPPARPRSNDPESGDPAESSPTEEPRTQSGAGSKQGGIPAIVCDRKKAFGAPVAVVGLPATEHLATPHLAADELTIYFTISMNGVAKLGRATRPSLNAPFVPDNTLAGLASSARDNDPSESADQRTLWFSSERNGQRADLFFASRATPKDPFGVPQLVPIVNGDAADNHPYFRARAQELWFSSQRNGADRAIFVALRGPTGFQAPVLVKELGTNVRHPMVTEDGLDIFFDASDREGSHGGTDLFTAHRDSTALPFSDVKALTTLNSSADENAGWMSPDGCRFYFSSDRDRANLHRIFVASR